MSYRPICDFWYLARCKYKGGVKRWGGYLGGFPERARVLLGASIDEPVLHVCGGLAHLYPYKGGYGPHDKRLDLDAETGPDYLQDARQPYPRDVSVPTHPGGPLFNIVPWRAILIDPPYTEADADKYAPGSAVFPPVNVLVKNALDALPYGHRVGIIHYLLPGQPKNAKFVASVAIACGFNNRLRCFSVFQKH